MHPINNFKLPIELGAALVGVFLICANQCLAEEKGPPSEEKMKAAEEKLFKKVPKLRDIHHSMKIPINFPLPVYTTNVVSTGFVNSTKGPVTAGASIITKDSAKAVFDWYKAQCTTAGWQVRTPKQAGMTENEKKGQVFILNAVKGDQQSTIFCSSNAKHPTTLINISWSKHKQLD